MTTPDYPILREPPTHGDEIETLLGSLDRQRATFAWKCGGLDAAGLSATVGASSMTLGGLLKHLAVVEADYFVWRLRGEDPGPPLNGADPDDDPDRVWHTAARDTPQELYSLWESAVERSRAATAAALAEGGLDQSTRRPAEYPVSLRRLLVDVVEEYARHTGHADLIRESVDGLVGEDPPYDR
ncbi:uncharacterized protein DUF664 [Stackebrandtia albiflava]|uniref:Uncharacterized protein DUF664 n=1 Tax=Stackebrandtia albiflava TaxID=406432 RepID=A0A562VEV7_9ACTN|nr:DinB family protein [Stackebrandtia albiflava]TWJ16364.1 uncharacterized protein DUF664 [Stackebrandtia albiflava]